MRKRVYVAGLFVAVLLISSAQAVNVERVRLIHEPTTVKDLFKSIVRGLGHKLGETPEAGRLANLKEAAERLGLQVEFISVTLRDGRGKEQQFSVKKADGTYQLTIEVPTVGFDFATVHHVSQTAILWATVRGYRVHFKQELEYNTDAGFVRLDLRVLNSLGRVTGLDFYGELYEENVGEGTAIKTGMTVSCRVPRCRIIRRIARRRIAYESDKALLTLDRKIRGIASQEEGNWLELVPILARRAVASVR